MESCLDIFLLTEITSKYLLVSLCLRSYYSRSFRPGANWKEIQTEGSRLRQILGMEQSRGVVEDSRRFWTGFLGPGPKSSVVSVVLFHHLYARPYWDHRTVATVPYSAPTPIIVSTSSAGTHYTPGREQGRGSRGQVPPVPLWSSLYDFGVSHDTRLARRAISTRTFQLQGTTTLPSESHEWVDSGWKSTGPRVGPTPHGLGLAGTL